MTSNKLLLAVLLLPALAAAATIEAWVFGTRDGRRVSYVWDGTAYAPTTNFVFEVSIQIPRRPNGTWVGWERETNIIASVRPSWNQVSNRVVRLIVREFQAAGITTNHEYVVRKGIRIRE